jgi:hypothetical protein
MGNLCLRLIARQQRAGDEIASPHPHAQAGTPTYQFSPERELLESLKLHAAKSASCRAGLRFACS